LRAARYDIIITGEN
jgi:hypothetical protein